MLFVTRLKITFQILTAESNNRYAQEIERCKHYTIFLFSIHLLLSSLQLFVSFGLLNYFFPFLPLLRPLFPIGHSHLPQIIPHIVLPSYCWPSLRYCCFFSLLGPLYDLGSFFITIYYACSITISNTTCFDGLHSSFLSKTTYCIHKLMSLLRVILYSVIFQGLWCPQFF